MVQTVATSRLNWKLTVAALALAGAAAFAAVSMSQRDALQARLLRALPDQAAADPQLVRLAIAQARPLYLQHCAGCHGADLQGNPERGAPNLADGVWLFGSGTVFDIERTLLYGVRAGRSKGHSLTDMPAWAGTLSLEEIRALAVYLNSVSHSSGQARARAVRLPCYTGQDCGLGQSR